MYGYTCTLAGSPPKMWTHFNGLPDLRVLYNGARHCLDQRMHRPWRKMRLPVPWLVYAERKTMGCGLA